VPARSTAEVPDVADGGPGAGGRSRRPRNHRTRRSVRRRRTAVAVVVVLAIPALVAGPSLFSALTRPGNDTTAQRVAEWARDHHLNWAVTSLEQAQYNLNPPATGGTLAAGIPKAGGETAPTKPAPVSRPHSPAPAALQPFVSNPAPGEGVWQPVVFSHGLPAVRLTYLRPDDGHTSFLASIMWLDPKLLSARLHEGSTDPGGRWPTPDHITTALARTVAATIPGGFRTSTGPVGNRGGYYDDHRIAEPLRTGAASFVVRSDGSPYIGAWGRDVRMSSSVRSVRQNLDLLVDGGQVDPTCSSGSTPVWGEGVGNQDFVPRTGIGQRADGSLVFVNSPVTSVCSLGRLLVQAGSVRAMELDINRDWTMGDYYTHTGGTVKAHVSRSGQYASADHYFSPQSRDFIAFSLR
jgi:type II secretory pathway pseudopilin PulG